MGCAFRKPETVSPPDLDTNDEEDDGNFFGVTNIDQEGNDHLPGKIEVTPEFLILHQPRRPPIQWPIRTLRRYGFEFNIFSFEAGRRCPTGEGIFAFRCVQAEQLFRLLQANIQRSCGNLNVPHGDISQSNYLEPRAVPMNRYRLESVGSSSSCPHTPVSPGQVSSPIYNFEERDIKTKSDDKKNYSPVKVKNSATSSPLYINVETGMDDDGKASSSQNPYLCLPEKYNKHYLELPPGKHYMDLPAVEGQVEESPENKLEYILVDVDSNKKPSSPVGKRPIEASKVSVGYTTIDFQRTWALLQSTKPNIENDIGCKRRTRHNSNLFGVR